MNEAENEVADFIESLINDSMQNSERSMWSQGKRIGVSDIGHCREYVRRMITNEEFTDDEPDSMAAFVGTALGDLLERGWSGPDVRTQVTVTVPLRAGDYDLALNLPGHVDIVTGNRVWDIKSKDRLGVVRRSGPSLKEKFQPTLYAHALIADGTLTHTKDDPVQCGLIYLDRSGKEGSRPHVVMWDYDPAIVEEAEAWLGDVMYAVQNGEEAPRDKERAWCYQYCPFATGCRGGQDTDVTGLISDPTLLAAVDTYRDAMDRERQVKLDKEAAKSVLAGISGNTRSGWSIRTVTVNEVEVPTHVRAGYERIDIRRARSARSKG